MKLALGIEMKAPLTAGAGPAAKLDGVGKATVSSAVPATIPATSFGARWMQALGMARPPDEDELKETQSGESQAEGTKCSERPAPAGSQTLLRAPLATGLLSAAATTRSLAQKAGEKVSARLPATNVRGNPSASADSKSTDSKAATGSMAEAALDDRATTKPERESNAQPGSEAAGAEPWAQTQIAELPVATVPAAAAPIAVPASRPGHDFDPSTNVPATSYPASTALNEGVPTSQARAVTDARTESSSTPAGASRPFRPIGIGSENGSSWSEGVSALDRSSKRATAPPSAVEREAQHGTSTEGARAAPAGEDSEPAGPGPNETPSPGGPLRGSDQLSVPGPVASATLPAASAKQDVLPAPPVVPLDVPPALPPALPQLIGTQVTVKEGSIPLGSRLPRSSSGAERAREDAQATAPIRFAGAAAPPVSAENPGLGRIGLETHAANGSSSAGETGARDTFAAMDAGSAPGSAPGPASWVHAGTQQAEAGFNDPALGWVSVRADLHGGGVHAAVLASSPESAAALGGDLAGLSAHLAARQIPVDSVTVSASSGQEANLSNDLQQGSGQGRGQSEEQGQALAAPADSSPEPPLAASIIPATGDGLFISPSAQTGGHVSVMA